MSDGTSLVMLPGSITAQFKVISSNLLMFMGALVSYILTIQASFFGASNIRLKDSKHTSI